MVPTRGTCHGVLLLAHSARSAARHSFDEWVSFARGTPTVMAAAIGLDAVARGMCECGLARLDGGRMVLHERLAALDGIATDEVLMTIASLLLEVDGPAWLHASMATGRFCPELVPSADLNALAWLGDYLEPLLVSVKHQDERDASFRAWLGRVGESLVVATERNMGASVRHVSLISDHFGYDVESLRGGRHRFEVKTSVIGAEHRLFLTRNEVTSAGRYAGEWFLVQVILKPEALTAVGLTRDHVHGIRQLDASSVIEVLPRDSEQCRWVETVELATSNLSWAPYLSDREIPAQWQFGGAPC